MLYYVQGTYSILGAGDDHWGHDPTHYLKQASRSRKDEGGSRMWPEIVRWGWQLLATAAIAYALLHRTDRR